jgi:hypothetical protein
VPFGGCVGARETDGEDLSEGVVADSVPFFSPAGCGGMGVEGRGECATPFYHDLESAYPLPMFHQLLPWKPRLQEPIGVLAS